MIKIDLRDKNKIIIKGHAMYDDYGKDIVCASVSSIVITTINAILEIDSDSIEYIEKDNYIEITILNSNEITNKLIKNMILLLEQLENDYKDNIKLIRR